MTSVIGPSWAKLNLCGCHEDESCHYCKRSSKWLDWSLGDQKNRSECQIRRPASKVKGKTMACDSTKWLQPWPRNVGNSCFFLTSLSTLAFNFLQPLNIFIYIRNGQTRFFPLTLLKSTHQPTKRCRTIFDYNSRVFYTHYSNGRYNVRFTLENEARC